LRHGVDQTVAIALFVPDHSDLLDAAKDFIIKEVTAYYDYDNIEYVLHFTDCPHLWNETPDRPSATAVLICEKKNYISICHFRN